MTYMKTSMIALTAIGLFSASFATANDAPASFETLDQDSNGVVNFSEFVIESERRDQNMTTALRQFNVISGGDQTFTQDQYAAAFALQGNIEAKDTDKTVIMPVESEKVLGAVATAIVIDEGSTETESITNTSSDLENKVMMAPEIKSDISTREMSEADLSASEDMDVSASMSQTGEIQTEPDL